MGMIDYRSDNTGRAAPEILEALIRANHGTALGYGADDYTAALQRHFSELFEIAVRVFPVATGTAANALALASLGPSWGNVYCSEIAHINSAEANATGFFGGGLKLVAVAGTHGKIAAEAFAEALAALLGPQAKGLSATTVTRLKAVWQQEYEAWGQRSLVGKHYVYVWADGVHFNIRLEQDRQCILVKIGRAHV